MIMHRWLYRLEHKELCVEFAKREDLDLVSEEESNDEELTEDDNDSGDEAPGAGSGDKPMDVDTIN